jgi:hypothetical protein
MTAIAALIDDRRDDRLLDSEGWRAAYGAGQWSRLGRRRPAPARFSATGTMLRGRHPRFLEHPLSTAADASASTRASVLRAQLDARRLHPR